MKIKKLIEAKQINEAEENETKDYSDAQDLKDVNPQTANVDEIEASIQKLVGEASDGEKEMWAKSAAQFAKDDKQVAQDLNAGYVAFDLTAEDWADVTITNDLYITLDRAYANALKSPFLKNGSNVIVNGLPGSGKTAIVEAWCKMRGLYLCPFNATDEKSDAAINGMPMRSDDDPSAIKYLFNTKKLEWLISKDPKYKHKCVAFVDELNRQKTAQLRRPLMSLFNEKRNADGTLDFSRNLLFSIVCINPSDGQGGVFHDVVADIFGAEDDRFDDQVEEFDSTIENAQVFWQWWHKRMLLRLGIIPPGTVASKNHGGWVGPTKTLPQKGIELAKIIVKAYTLAMYILDNIEKSDESEIFSQRADIDAEFRGVTLRDKNGNLLKDNNGQVIHGKAKRRPVTSRGLFNGIINATDADDQSPVKVFLWWVDKRSKYSELKVKMFHDILDSYVMDVKSLYAKYNLDKDPKEIEADLKDPDAAKAKQAAKAATQAATEPDSESDLEDDNSNFSDDELSDVSAASTDDLDANIISGVMDTWDD